MNMVLFKDHFDISKTNVGRVLLNRMLVMICTDLHTQCVYLYFNFEQIVRLF